MTNDINMNDVEGTPPEKPSIFGMIMNPTEQFERIRKNPKIIVALIVVTLLTVVGMLLMLNGIDFIGDDPELLSMDEEALVVITFITQISFILVGIFTPIITILISSAIYFGIAKLIQSTVTFKQLFSMTTFIGIINAISIVRSEEHTSELQSRGHIVCRLLLDKKKVKQSQYPLLDDHFLPLHLTFVLLCLAFRLSLSVPSKASSGDLL